MGFLDRLGFGASAEAKKRVEDLQKRLKTNPTNVACALSLADAMVDSGALKSAVKLLNQLGPTLQQNGQFLAAIAVYKKSVALDPKAEDPGTKVAQRELKRLETAAQTQTLPVVGPKRPGGPSAEDTAKIQLKRESIHPVLQSIPLFKDVPLHLVDQLIEKFHIKTFDAGETIFKEGAPGSSLIFVVSGELTVTGSGEKGEEINLRTLIPGDVAGEMSFISSLPRSASIKTTVPSAVLELERRAVDPLVAKSPALKEALNTLYRERVLTDVLVRSIIFGSLPQEARDEIASRLVATTVEAGSHIPKDGSSSEDLLYLIASGLVRLSVLQGEKEVEKAILYPPSFFGQMQTTDGPVLASAVTDCELFILYLADVAALLQKYPRFWTALAEMQIERLKPKPKA